MLALEQACAQVIKNPNDSYLQGYQDALHGLLPICGGSQEYEQGYSDCCIDYAARDILLIEKERN